jgi:hypothetical protein
MLHYPSSSPPPANGQANLLREFKTATWRAFLALDLASDGLTLAQACAVAGASIGYVATLRRLTTYERNAVREGRVSLGSFHTRKPFAVKPEHGKHFDGDVPTPSDDEVERIVLRLGPMRVLNAVDKLTAPDMFSVAAE